MNYKTMIAGTVLASVMVVPAMADHMSPMDVEAVDLLDMHESTVETILEAESGMDGAMDLDTVSVDPAMGGTSTDVGDTTDLGGATRSAGALATRR